MPNLYWPERRPGRRRERRLRLQAWQAAESAARKVLLVTHAECLDGVGAAIVTLRALGPDQVGVLYARPDEMAEVLDHVVRSPGQGRRLLIADLSLQKPDYPRIVAACSALRAGGWRVEWRDHHHKQWEGLDLRRLRREVAVLEVEAQESGASLQQRALAPQDGLLADLARCIRDRDLWLNRDP
ncbi:MAG TPA: hypothetical protein VI796_03195, partial [Candidatus Thermoplasmatota archaeon]|nr:hypothetical protein [Candidatus Thermoplasmatota archaeon]